MESAEESCDYETANFGVEDCEALLDYFSRDCSEKTSEIDLVSVGSANDSCEPFNTVSSTCNGLHPSNVVVKREKIDYSSCSLEECLSENQELQRYLQEILKQLEIGLQKNIAKQDEIIEAVKTADKEGEFKLRRSKPISLFAAPYFRDVRGMVAPDNEDTLEKYKRKDVTAFLCQPKPWSRVDKDRLIEGVAANAKSIVIRPYKLKRDHWKSKLRDKNLFDFELKIIQKQINRIERKIEDESDRPLFDILNEAKDKIDWMTISATNLQGLKTEEECEIMWNNYLSCYVNKEAFTDKEDKRLKKLVMKYHAKNWEKIAEELKTNRTAIQCLERYQTHLNEELTKKYWTEEEDAMLLKVVESLRVGKYIPWNKVCCYMEGRTRHQIINRYERTVNREIKRESFSQEEDAMILALVKRYICNWNKMKDFLPGRTAYAIRERYVNTLDPTLKIGDWSIEEDKRLIRLIQRYGYGKWAKVSREMPCRTDNMCLVRARRLELHAIRKRRIKANSDQIVKLDDSSINLLANAPSKCCKTQNLKLKRVQKWAQNTLRTALQNIQPYASDEINLETCDTSAFTVASLQLLQKELIGGTPEENCSGEKWIPHYIPLHTQKNEMPTLYKRKKVVDFEDFLSSDEEKPIRKKNKSMESDEESDIIETERNEPHLSTQERLWLSEVLEARLQEEASLLPSGLKPKPISLNARETVEFDFYTNYLKKNFSCKPDPESDEKVSDLKPEYQKNLTEVIKYFIQPDTGDSQLSVLCPNAATLGAMEVIEATKTRLRKTAGFMGDSKKYLKYLVGQKSTAPECAKCKGGRGAPSEEVRSQVLDQMQQRLLLNEGHRFMKIVDIELGFPTEECKCEKIMKSKEQFSLLQKRFLSLFLWPSLFSYVDLTEQQKSRLGKNVPNKYTASQVRGRTKEFKYIKKEACSESSSQSNLTSTEKNPVELKKPRKRIKKDKAVIASSPRSVMSTVDNSKLRRSQRSCVANRKSFIKFNDPNEKDSENSNENQH